MTIYRPAGDIIPDSVATTLFQLNTINESYKDSPYNWDINAYYVFGGKVYSVVISGPGIIHEGVANVDADQICYAHFFNLVFKEAPDTLSDKKQEFLKWLLSFINKARLLDDNSLQTHTTLKDVILFKSELIKILKTHAIPQKL